MRQNLLADTTVGVVKFRNQASELSVQNRIAVGQAIDVGNKPRCCLGMGLGNLIGQKREAILPDGFVCAAEAYHFYGQSVLVSFSYCETIL